MEIILKTIPCTLLAMDDFSVEDAESLLNTDLSHLIEIVSNPIKSLGDLKLECFKQQIMWYKEKDCTIFTFEKEKVMKTVWYGNWIQLNPNMKNMEYNLKDAIFNILEVIPKHFTIFLGNTPLALKELSKELEMAPF